MCADGIKNTQKLGGPNKENIDADAPSTSHASRIRPKETSSAKPAEKLATSSAANTVTASKRVRSHSPDFGDIPDSPIASPNVEPPAPKRKKPSDVEYLMEEETKNFKCVSGGISAIKEVMVANSHTLISIENKLDELVSLKKEEIKENKRHHIQMEKHLLTRNELKLKSIELEQLKMGL